MTIGLIDNFNGSSLSPTNWTLINNAGTVAVSGGQLTLGSGTTSPVLSADVLSMTGNIQLQVGSTSGCAASFLVNVSQRIANQTIYLEMFSATKNSGAAIVLDGVTATSAKLVITSNGVTKTVSGLTIATSATMSWLTLVVTGKHVAVTQVIPDSRTIPTPIAYINSFCVLDGLFQQNAGNRVVTLSPRIRINNAATVTNTNVVLECLQFYDPLSEYGYVDSTSGAFVNMASVIS